ncbi:hypothetical protein GGR56DRAFT_660665 [Xylariaceae sp. FL0804]|nr:hypothetical protein GGR56DRAFT_660665 [Xylariaceae sp. FL0804]
MTLQVGPDKRSSWGVGGVQFGVNEVSSMILIGKSCGSVANRQEYSGMFDQLQEGLGIHIKRLPVWLEGIKFQRSTTIYGQEMRVITLPAIMEDVDKRKLSGISTFVVLCCRFSENRSVTMKALNLLLCGGLGAVVDVDGNTRADLPYTFKPHMKKFVESCLDADVDSNVANQARKWMSELNCFGKLGWRSEEFAIERQQASFGIISEILGGTSTESQLAELSVTPQRRPREKEPWARIHNTLHLSSAYIALSAAAQGADVVVECINSKDPKESKFFPFEPKGEQMSSTFLVRLWLVQPPEHVCGILRFSSNKQTTTWQDGEQEPADDMGNNDVVIFGGARELALWVAGTIHFTCERTEHVTKLHALMELWESSAEFARTIRWGVKKQYTCHDPLRFVLEKNIKEPSRSAAPLQLSKALRVRDKRLAPISTEVANVVHAFYNLTDYSIYLDDEESEFVNAMYFVLIGAAVEKLRNMMHAPDTSLDQYAMSLTTLEAHKGDLRELIPLEVSEGISSQNLLFAAATLWGGASLESQGHSRADDGVLGVVAPNCTVILDFIRQPLLFVKDGIDRKLMSLWRGAVPMLPRDPQTNFVKAFVRGLGKTTQIDARYQPSDNKRAGKKRGMSGNLIFTFEPYLEIPTLGVFCCYYSGHLTCEICPTQVFGNILRRQSHSFAITGREYSNFPHRTPDYIFTLGPMDLLTVKTFTVSETVCVVVDNVKSLEWALLAAGCGPVNVTRAHRGNIADLDVEGLLSEKKLTAGEVLLIISQ